MLCTLMSAIACWGAGYTHKGFHDPVIFKSVFVVFGFSMGFRNVRANQRYFDAQQHCEQFYAAWWGIYLPLPRDIRLKVKTEFLQAFEECRAYAHRVGTDRRHAWFAVVGIEPATQSSEFI